MDKLIINYVFYQKNEKMSRLLLLLFCLTIVGCGSFKTFQTSTLQTNIWIEEPILNSEIDYSGNFFFERTLKDGVKIALYFDEKTELDGGSVYVQLMNDFGWTFNGESWNGSAYNRTMKLGHMYVNPRKKLALHINYENTYKAFKVHTY